MNIPPSRRVRVQREREFAPHHILLGAAIMALERAERKEPGWFYDELIAMTFSSLALEALANAFGSRLISKWDDFESAKPVAKIRILAQHLGVGEVDFSSEPWSTVIWLSTFRNKVVHAKPESVKFDAVMSYAEFEERRLEYPKSKLELNVCTENAKRAVGAVREILDTFCTRIPPEELVGLLSDGYSGSVTGEEPANEPAH